ncbi:hypothetical protein [uncultured Ruminococcus sp.]|jgi:hypothetical protein|uniref:hypothetical protein n=1 Tax=uncultured Ruminococcus sp. TaxID=165186 RepID=UPI0026741C39|nr:hypothetical protein [uncultured Ruminococcus sp.]
MITAKIVELFFSLPFFKSFSISDEAYSALRDMISFLYQLDQFLNLELMFESIFFVLGLLLVSALVNFVRGFL